MLTDTQARNARPRGKPYKPIDSHGLYLEVRPNGSRSWRYRYRIAGEENLYAAGEYPATSIAETRFERDKAGDLVKQGIHPAHIKDVLKRVEQKGSPSSAKQLRTWIGGNFSSRGERTVVGRE
jgi:hypothetical protein